MSRDEKLMRSCLRAASQRLGPFASDAEVIFDASLIFGFAAGLWSDVNTTFH